MEKCADNSGQRSTHIVHVQSNLSSEITTAIMLCFKNTATNLSPASKPILHLGALFLVILLSGCMASITTHQFQYYGTDALLSGRDFDYVKVGLKGKSHVTYKPYRGGGRGGGYVRDGLVADAKRDLRSQYTLGRNEAYSNVSIDVLTTRTGPMTQGGLNEDRIDLTVVITADVVRLGGAVGIADPNVSLSGSLGSLSPIDSNGEGLIIEDSWSDSQDYDSEVAQSEEKPWYTEVGREVFLVHKKVVCAGTIKRLDAPYIVVAFTSGGKEKSKYCKKKEIYRTMAEAQAETRN